MTEPDTWTLTWFRHARAARRGLRINLSGEELTYQLRAAAPHRDAKTELPLICGAIFRGNHRRNANVEAVHLLGLDIDVPQVDPDAYVAKIASTLGGVELFAYSTFSSAHGAFKLRVFIGYDRGAMADEHRQSWALVTRLLERAGVHVDRACSDAARGFYVWAIPPNGAYWHAHLPGVRWPVGLAAEVEAERIAEETRRREEDYRQRAGSISRTSLIERARRYVEKMPPAIAGGGGHAQTFRVARRLIADFSLNENDALAILEQYNLRCQPPWSARELKHKLTSAKDARVRVPMVHS